MKIYQDYKLIQTVREAEDFRTPKNIFLQCLIFGVVFFFMSLIEGLGTIVIIFPKLIEFAGNHLADTGSLADAKISEKITTMFSDPAYTNVMLFCTGLGTLVVLFFCRVIEDRHFYTMGFSKEKAGIQYIAGLLTGFVMFSCVVGLAWLFGGLQFEGVQKFSLMILLVLLGFGIQGMSEEVLCRGYFMTTVMRHHHVWLAIGLNSLFFGLLHASNAGFSLFALLNLILYAVMISLYTLRTNSLWGACAVHSIWNFAQGNFYGLPVSGIDSGESVFKMSLKGSDFINGGAFGLEAGLPTTIVMTVCICILLFCPLPFVDKKTEETGETEA